jgi:caffeoyl-CoA O-methyltransferase
MADIMNDFLRKQMDDYASALFVQEDETLRWIQAQAEANQLPAISVRPFEGRLLQILVALVGAKTVIEIGALAGYSGTWLARALPADGKLYTLEKSAKHAAIARASFERAGVANRVELLEGDAHTSLSHLAQRAPFDMIFLDADKVSYPAYLKWAVANLRPGGLVAAHNAFRSGKVLNAQTDDDRAMDAFNRALAAEPTLDSMILAIGDGMAVGIKQRG